MVTDNIEESNAGDIVIDRSNQKKLERVQTTLQLQDIRSWRRSALRSLEAERVTKLPAFKMFLKAARCNNLLPCIKIVMFEGEAGESKEAYKSLKLREAFWHTERTAVNEKYLGRITKWLTEGLQLDLYASAGEVIKFKPSARCKNKIIHALDLLGRNRTKGILQRTFKSAVSCLSPEELSPVLNSNVIHEHLGRISYLEDDAFALLNMDSLTTRQLPHSEQDRGWIMDGRWVTF